MDNVLFITGKGESTREILPAQPLSVLPRIGDEIVLFPKDYPKTDSRVFVVSKVTWSFRTPPGDEYYGRQIFVQCEETGL